MKKLLFLSSMFTIFIMMILGLVSIWQEVWLGKPMASLGVIFVGLVSCHLISWLFKNE